MLFFVDLPKSTSIFSNWSPSMVYLPYSTAFTALHFFHLDNGVLFLFEVIGDDTQTTVGRVVQLRRIFTGKALHRLLVIKFVFRA
ncbi:Uncharacterised protein [Escherichia coli]|nr:Uncharacterised protein [Escherichia coli]